MKRRTKVALALALVLLAALCLSALGGKGSLPNPLVSKGITDADAAASPGLASPEPARQRTCTVCCVGDSLTYGFAAGDPASQSYPAVLAGLEGKGIRFRTENYGLSGACVDPDDVLPYTASTEYAASLETKAEVVLVMLGTNDAFRSPNRDRLEESFAALLRGYLDLPQAPLVVVVLPPHVFIESYGVRYDDKLEEVAAVEARVAAQLGLPVIDARSFSEGREDLFADGVHFTSEGYALLAETICTQLCEILQG